MCLIVDADAASEMFARPPKADAIPAIKWVLCGDGRVVYGGQLARELSKVGQARRTLVRLKQAGRAIEIEADRVHDQTICLIQSDVCASNDPHVIALAQLSHVRVLFSHDTKLHTDFKNKRLIDKPRGEIYQTAQHARLLRHTPKCIGNPSRYKKKPSR